MQVSISARHCTIPDTLRAEAEKRLQKLQRYEPRMNEVMLEFNSDHGSRHVETRVFVTGSHSIIAHGYGDTFRSALDQSFDRLTRRLKRRRERVREHQAAKLSELHADSAWRSPDRESAHG